MAKQNNIKSIQYLINCDRSLNYLSNRSQQLRSLNDAFIAKLPSLLGQYCQLCDYQNGVAIIETPSQAVATQLRFTKPQLIKWLASSKPFYNLQDIQVKISQPETTRHKPQRHTLVASPENRDNIRATADYIEASIQPNKDYKEAKQLANSLRSLAATLEKLDRK